MVHAGSLLGLAFQGCDDWLDIFGDSAITGKLVGADIRSGKRTMIWLCAKQQLNAEDWTRIEINLWQSLSKQHRLRDLFCR